LAKHVEEVDVGYLKLTMESTKVGENVTPSKFASTNQVKSLAIHQVEPTRDQMGKKFTALALAIHYLESMHVPNGIH
jgi:hypothetical protein